MIKITTRDFSQHEWHDIVSAFDDLTLMQLWEYGEAKKKLQGWQVVRHAFFEGDAIVGAAQAVVKMISFLKKGIVWINRAPLWQKHGNTVAVLPDMLHALRYYWVDERKMYLRIAPALFDAPEQHAMIVQSGYKKIPSSEWISGKIDLTQSHDALRVHLEKKWRNCLAKAEQLGVTSVNGTADALLSEFFLDYEAFLKAKDFHTPITPEFIRCFQKLLPDDRKMWVFAGRLHEKKLGSILIAQYGKGVEYLVGAVREEGKNVNAGQLLLWHALLAMKKEGFSFLDLGGAHPEKTPKGILHFKNGLHATPYRLVGEFDATGGIVSSLIKILLRYHS